MAMTQKEKFAVAGECVRSNLTPIYKPEYLEELGMMSNGKFTPLKDLPVGQCYELTDAGGTLIDKDGNEHGAIWSIGNPDSYPIIATERYLFSKEDFSKEYESMREHAESLCDRLAGFCIETERPPMVCAQDALMVLVPRDEFEHASWEEEYKCSEETASHYGFDANEFTLVSIYDYDFGNEHLKDALIGRHLFACGQDLGVVTETQTGPGDFVDAIVTNDYVISDFNFMDKYHELAQKYQEIDEPELG